MPHPPRSGFARGCAEEVGDYVEPGPVATVGLIDRGSAHAVRSPVSSIRGWSPQALHVFGWVGIFLFGLGVAVLVPRLFVTGAEIRIDAEGVYLRSGGGQVIPWSAINRITTVDGGRVQLAYLFLKDPAVLRRRRRLGAKSFGDVAVSLQGTDGKISEMRAAFDHFAPGRRDRARD